MMLYSLIHRRRSVHSRAHRAPTSSNLSLGTGSLTIQASTVRQLVHRIRYILHIIRLGLKSRLDGTGSFTSKRRFHDAAVADYSPGAFVRGWRRLLRISPMGNRRWHRNPRHGADHPLGFIPAWRNSPVTHPGTGTLAPSPSGACAGIGMCG